MDILKNLKKAEWINLLISIVFIIVGVVLICNPNGALQAISFVIGGAFVILGLVKVFKYLKDKKSGSEMSLDLALAMIAIVMGLVIILCNSAIETIFRIVIGVFIIYSAITRFELVKMLKTTNTKEWIASLVVAIATLICGLYMILVPGTVVAVAGVIIVIYGIMNLIQSIMFMKNSSVIVIK